MVVAMMHVDIDMAIYMDVAVDIDIAVDVDIPMTDVAVDIHVPVDIDIPREGHGRQETPRQEKERPGLWRQALISESGVWLIAWQTSCTVIVWQRNRQRRYRSSWHPSAAQS